MSRPKTFRVTFTETRLLRIDILKRSPAAAIRDAKCLLYSDEDRFVSFGGRIELAARSVDAEEAPS